MSTSQSPCTSRTERDEHPAVIQQQQRVPASSSLPDILAALAPAYDSIGLLESDNRDLQATDSAMLPPPPPPPPPLSGDAMSNEGERSDLKPTTTTPRRSPLLRAQTDSALSRQPDLDLSALSPERKRATLGTESINNAVAHDSSHEKATLRLMANSQAPWSPQPQPQAKLVLEKFTLYETKTKLYVIASNQADSRYRVLKVDRSAPPPPKNGDLRNESDNEDDDGDDASGLAITEDPAIYSKQEIQQLLETLSAGNAGGIARIEPLFYGIAGFVRFTSAYYMIIIKSRAPVALVGGHYIYHCEETALRPITPLSSNKNAEEARQMASFQGVDLSKNFYFSYTYDLTHTLQHNLTRKHDRTDECQSPLAYLNDKWVWNRHLLRPAFRHLKGRSPWVLPLIYGFVDQAKLSVFGRTVYVTLIARRSRHFAGARFLKRGVNDQGFVANDVETEQIVFEALTTPFHAPAHASHTHQATGVKHQNRQPNPRYTSFVQVRGSIPLFWSQESVNMTPKPPIELTVADPYYSAAALHFDDLLGRYGSPITVLNLIKHKERAPRESKLLPEFKQCIDYLNQFLSDEHRINYIAWDIAAANKQRDKDVIGILEDIAEESLERTNFFHSGPEPYWYALHAEQDVSAYRSTPLLQNGIVRTNCIDCLDRTNAAQFVIAKAALGHQLHALGVIHDPLLPFDSDAVNLITEMYHDHGDTIALQYGGSHLVNTMETYRKIGQWSSHSRDMIENLRRFYTNSFVDADKQAAIDLFLGIEAPVPRVPVHTYVPPKERRSYRDWYTPSHLQPVMTSSEAMTRLQKAVEADDDGTVNYWQSYYRPKLFTELARHFAFKVNSTLKYKVLTNGSDSSEHSPFVPRLAPFSAPAQKRSGPPGRRWLHSRQRTVPESAAVAARGVRGDKEQREDYKSTNGLAGSSGALPSSTEGIVARLLNPSVDRDEQQEYGSWIAQFDHLSLGQDLSDKDSLLYEASVDASLGQLSVTSEGVALYESVCARARPT
ncbi:hypothetical protein ACM66B_000653 [Microbotryomycetes sp. NB124-2]